MKILSIQKFIEISLSQYKIWDIVQLLIATGYKNLQQPDNDNRG